MNSYQMMNPEAFTAEYEEEQQILAELARPEETEVEFVEVDLTDMVREHDENLTDEERDEVNARREEEWLKFYDTGIEFPYEM